ncbi:redox-regulated ATPase YchF [Candidatus Woesearchaeota archaeon]|nr:redox-regulated ATPase YchF [Candidatus Woesearchaeota archaeon]
MLIGIVGKPSCGKSTFFKAATLAEAEIANYPFTTIKANHGVGYVKVECADKDFNVKCNPRFGYCIDGVRFVPVDLLDVAGLVPGAHKGLGRGNEFLDDLNQADVLVHVIDVSGSVNEKGEPVEPLSYDPVKDVKFLEVELDMWYFRNITKGWEKFARQVQQENADIKQALAKQLSFLRITENMLEDVIKKLGLNKEKPIEWTQDNLKQMASELRRTTKPMIIAANKVDVPGASENFARLQNEFPDYIMVACSAESELALKEAAKHELIKYIPGDKDFELLKSDKLNDQQKKALEFVKENVLKKFGSTGIQQVLDDAVFKLLKYIAIFPGGVNKLEDKDGNVLPDCFLLPQGSTALDFAYNIHTDLGDNFIKAISVRTKQIIGKDHVLNNRDVIEIVTRK